MKRTTYLAFLIAAAISMTHAWAAVPDPGTTGPLAVSSAEYDFGDTAFNPAGFPGPIELRGVVFYPTTLAAGPYPLLVLLHGRHATCYVGAASFLQWPCDRNRAAIPSYHGYDYLASALASNGYIVISISANGVNARDNRVFDLGALARAQLIQKHLDIWNTFNTVGGAPFGSQFVGKVDLTRVGTMGHSRGGEGVVRHFAYNVSLGSPYTVLAVLPLAPVDFNRTVINNVALEVVLPYCDGDVSDLQGVHFYDDARYNVVGDTGPKHTVLVMGANHDFFNTIWTPGLFPAGARDDWMSFVVAGSEDQQCGRKPSSQRLSPTQQQGTLLAYAMAFLRAYVGGETQFLPILKGSAPPPASATTSQIHVSYHPAALSRLDINSLLSAANLSVNNLGGAVTQSGITPYELCGGDAPELRFCLPGQPNNRQPHTTPSARAPAKRGLSQLQSGWTGVAQFHNALGGAVNITAYDALQFRASVNFNDARNPLGVAQDMSVILTDTTANTCTVRAGQYSDALYFPPGGQFGAAVLVPPFPVPKVFLNTVRIPVSAFSCAGFNPAAVQSVRFTFDRTNTGELLISDVALAK
ncbi:MAG TPA: hypothetical protein VKE70_27485 [Candidatus Solibacter sp.]|nr:hypothetical protein [Candidatus Solibacter sp.]